MSLYPELIVNSSDSNSRHLLTKINKSYEESSLHNNILWAEADRDSRVYAGDARLNTELYNNQPYMRRANFSFNHTKKVVSTLEGYQRQNRKTIVATPVENADEETADQYTKLFFWLASRISLYETFSDACRGSLITGLNLLHIYNNYSKDPISGDIVVDALPMTSFVIDPYFKKQDLSDCNYIMRRTYVTKSEAMALMPGKDEEIENFVYLAGQDGRFQFMPETFAFDLGRYLAYDEYYYRCYRTQKLLVNTKTGETREWTWPDKERELDFFLRHHPHIIVYENSIPTVKLAIVINNKVMYNGNDHLGGDDYPFVPVFCYFQPELPYYSLKIQGVVRGLRDAQYLYNRRRQIEDDILSSQVNSGFIYKEDALVDPRDIFMTGQGKGIALKSDAAMTDVVKIPTAEIHPSVFQVSENYRHEMLEVTGLSEENLAASAKDIPGVLAMIRQGQGLIANQGVFDGFDRSLKLLGRRLLNAIQTHWMPGKVANILGEQPAPQFYNKAFGIYDVIVEEGMLTSTQRSMQLGQLVQFRELGLPIPTKTMIDAATLQNKKKLMEDIEQIEQQQAQQQQMQMQLEMHKLQAETKLADARAEADYGQAVERTSRVAENEALAVERRAQAVHDQNAALLNLVKAIKEVDGMDLQHLQTVLQMQGIIKAQEAEVQSEAVPQQAKAVNSRPQSGSKALGV